MIYYVAARNPDYEPGDEENISLWDEIQANLEDTDYEWDQSEENPPPVDMNLRLSDKELAEQDLCEICGFRAVDPDEPLHCMYCYTETYIHRSGPFMQYGNWVHDRQLYYFSVRSDTEAIHFYRPESVNGYTQDPDWQPSVTEAEVRAYSRTHTYIKR